MSWEVGSCGIVFVISLNCQIQTDRATRWQNQKPVNTFTIKLGDKIFPESPNTCMISTSVQRKQRESVGRMMGWRAGESQNSQQARTERRAGSFENSSCNWEEPANAKSRRVSSKNGRSRSSLLQTLTTDQPGTLFRIGYWLEKKPWKETIEKGKKPEVSGGRKEIQEISEQAAMFFRSSLDHQKREFHEVTRATSGHTSS